MLGAVGAFIGHGHGHGIHTAAVKHVGVRCHEAPSLPLWLISIGNLT
jgi:hypothetical protein